MHLLLLLAPLLQDPSPTAPPDPAREAWDARIKTYAEASAIRVEASVVSEDPAAEENEAVLMKLTLDAELMKPNAGRLLLTGFAQEFGQEPDPFHELYHGDGERVLRIEREAKRAWVVGPSWSDCDALFFLDFLGSAWCGEVVEAKELRFAPQREDRAGWLGFLRSVPDPYGELRDAEAWFDEHGVLRSFTLPIGGAAHFVVTIHALELVEDALPKPFLHASPDGFQVIAADGMLEVGSLAPEVRLVGMDEVEFTLASLRGKTVLLNFWFYH